MVLTSLVPRPHLSWEVWSGHETRSLLCSDDGGPIDRPRQIAMKISDWEDFVYIDIIFGLFGEGLLGFGEGWRIGRALLLCSHLCEHLFSISEFSQSWEGSCFILTSWVAQIAQPLAEGNRFAPVSTLWILNLTRDLGIHTSVELLYTFYWGRA